MRAFIALAVVLSLLDALSTMLLIGMGYREMNPLPQLYISSLGLMAYPAIFFTDLASLVGGMALIRWLAFRLHAHQIAVRISAIVLLASLGWVVASNLWLLVQAM